MRRAFIVMLAMLSPSLLQAATVRVEGMNAAGAAVVTLSGQIEKGDSGRFLATTAQVRDAVIVLNSPGGLVSEGLAMARIVNTRGFTTVVQPGKVCASMCAVVWLAGRRRTMADDARIGFHAAAVGKSGMVSSSGNAVVGAYLNSLGFNMEIVAYVTAAAPKSISWLTRAKAAEIAIEISPLSALATQVAGPPTTAPSLDLVAVIHGRTMACERQVMEDVWQKSQAGRSDLNSYFFLNGRSINQNCKSLEPGASIVIREADPSIPMVCAEPAEGQRCLWIALQAFRVDPSRPAWAAPVPLAQRDDATVCRLAILPTGRGWDSKSWSAVQEADRRGLRLETCLTLAGYNMPAPSPSPARRASPVVNVVRLALSEIPAAVTAACREALTQGWPDSADAQALRARGFTRERCRSGVLMADALELARAAAPVDVPVAERETPSLCFMALNLSGTAWDMAVRAYMNEALRRGLTIRSCRAALVCSTVAPATVDPHDAPLACKASLSDEPAEVLCAAALSDDGRGWTEDPLFGYAVAEIDRRQIERDECIRLATTERGSTVKSQRGPVSAVKGSSPP